ncbi:putative OPA3-like protein CG13603 [Scaptodrosophila lebanonensis]|uniref:OPA3-like protein CG13603 n=1 Tax=Drosophila lebanonensis TaxID=7225 RepID=A0A6J2T4B7_DROLE|nr:putative OPA3-like protein CG13603 [Scaptodrosophila lebanonensis]
MVVGAFPIAKLGMLTVRHISKPVSNLIKRSARSNQFVKNFVCTPPAQLYNWLEVRGKMLMLRMKQPKRVPPLNDAMAIEVGGDILGELIIFIIGVSLIMLEFSRQARNERKKQNDEIEEKEELRRQIAKMKIRICQQAKEIKKLKEKLGSIEASVDQECY